MPDEENAMAKGGPKARTRTPRLDQYRLALGRITMIYAVQQGWVSTEMAANLLDVSLVELMALHRQTDESVRTGMNTAIAEWRAAHPPRCPGCGGTMREHAEGCQFAHIVSIDRGSRAATPTDET